MPVKMIEGHVENGQIKLDEEITLPEKTKVYITLEKPAEPSRRVVHLLSPRLVHPEDAVHFKKTVVKETDNA